MVPMSEHVMQYVVPIETKLLQEAPKQMSKKPIIVYRFLGTTPQSSNLDTLFLSLCHQIAELYGVYAHGSEKDFNAIRPAFYEVLEQVGTQKHKPPLLLVLDSLDQLSNNYGAHSMSWLPQNLPSNVTLLLSVMPGYESILDRLQARLRPASFVELAQFTPERAATVFKNLLANEGRTLTKEQMERAVLCLKHSPTPLLIHLTVLEARRWNSSTPENELRLGNSAREAVKILFDRMERDHGSLLVSHALSYIVISKNGLTEKEMEEILSLDNDVMNDVYQYWPPPSDLELRIPPAIWARLRQDMADFIMNRQADGKTVMGVYHKQFVEVIRSRYLSNEETKRAVLSNLIEYFAGIWAGKAKPIQMRILKETNPKPHFRKVRAQPLRFGGTEGRYNLRKLSELPYLLISSWDFDTVKSDCLLNFEWIQGKFEACGMTALLDDFSLYQSEQQESREGHDEDRPVALVAKALRMSKSTLEYPDCEDILATEIIGRCSDLVDEFSEIKLIVESARKWCTDHVPKRLLLIPENQTFIRPNGALLTTLPGHHSGVTSMACTEDNKFLITAGKDWALRVWDMDTDSIMHILELKGYPEAIAIDNVSDTFYVVEGDGSFSSYDLKSGTLGQKNCLRDLYEEFIPHNLNGEEHHKQQNEEKPEKPKTAKSLFRRRSTKDLIASESPDTKERGKSGKKNAHRPQTRAETRNENSPQNGRNDKSKDRVKTGRKPSTARHRDNNSSSPSKSISPEKSRRIPSFESDEFAKMEKFKKIVDSKTVCRIYHSTMVIYWGGHLFLFDIDGNPKIMSVLSPGGKLVSIMQYHEALIMTLEGKKICYINMKSFQSKLVTFSTPAFSNALDIVGVGIRSGGSLIAVVNHTDGAKIMRLSTRFGEALSGSENFQLFADHFCDGLATKTSLNKHNVAIAGRKCFSVSITPDSSSSEAHAKCVRLEAEICSLELLSSKREIGSNVVLVGCKDESVRVYDCDTVAIRNYLPGLWGPPEILLTMKSTVYTGTNSAQFVKVWNLVSQESSDVPIHFNSSHVRPVCTWSEKENAFLAASTDIDGRTVYIANSSGIVDAIPLPQHHEAIEGLLLLSRTNELIFSNNSGDIFKMTYEPMKAEPNQDIELIAELRHQIRTYHYSADINAALILLTNDRIVKMDLEKLEFQEIPISTDIVPDQPPIPVISVMSESTNRRVSTVPESQGHLAAVAICEYGMVVFRYGTSSLFLKGVEGEIIRRFLFDFAGIFALRRSLLAVQTAEETIQILDLTDSNKAPVEIEYGSSLPITSLELSTDGTLLFLGSGNAEHAQFGQRQIRIYNTKDGTIARRKAYMYSPVSSIDMLGPDLLAVCLKVGYFAIYKLHRPDDPKTLRKISRQGLRANHDLAPARNHQKRSSACALL